MTTTALLEELERQFRDNPRRYFARLANEYRKAGDLDSAIEICRAHVPQQPGYISGHIVLGQALYDRGELDDARRTFSNALALDPENLIALRQLGDIAGRQEDGPEARRYWERLLEVDPGNEDVTAQLALLAPTVVAAPSAADANGDRAEDTRHNGDAMPRADGATFGRRPGGADEALEWVAPAVGISSFGDGAQDDELIVEFEPAQSPRTGTAGVANFGDAGAELEPLDMESAVERDPLLAQFGDEAESSDAFLLSHERPTTGDTLEAFPGDSIGARANDSWSAELEDDAAWGSEGEGERSEPGESSVAEVHEPGGDRLFDVEPSIPDLGDAPAFGLLDMDLMPAAPAPLAATHRDGAPERALTDVGDVPAGDRTESARTDDDMVSADAPFTPDAEFSATPAVEMRDMSTERESAIREGAREAAPTPATAGRATDDLDLGPSGAAPAPFVTETIAELYLQQGFRDKALQVYRRLSADRPSDAALQQRLAEIESEPLPFTESAPAADVSERPRTVRALFAVLAQRRPPAASTTPLESPARGQSADGTEPTDTADLADGQHPALPASGSTAEPAASSMDAEEAREDESPAAGVPARAADGAMSLDRLVGASAASGVDRESARELVSASAGAAAASSAAEPADRRSVAELEAFNAWLAGLKD
ncbi:MAG: tetratricopeptide repeat protein [Gemmatimonadaceae bacterium]